MGGRKRTMKKLALILALLLGCAALFVACGTEDDGAPAGMQAVNCDGLPYTTYLPDQWVVKTPGNMLEAVVSSSTPVAITVRHFPVQVENVSAYWEKTEAELKESLLEYKLEEIPTRYALCGQDDGLAVSYSGCRGGRSYRFYQVMTIKDGILYLVTYSAETNVKTGTDLYGTYFDDAYRVIENMKFQTPAESVPPESATDENGMLALNIDNTGWDVAMSVPSGWIDESYGTFAFARDPESGASVSLMLETTEVTYSSDYWKQVVTDIKSLYPMSVFEYETESDTVGDKLVVDGDSEDEEVFLGGTYAQRMEYVLVTENARYACVKIVSVEKYPLHVLTFTYPLTAGGDEKAERAHFESLVSAITKTVKIGE